LAVLRSGDPLERSSGGPSGEAEPARSAILKNHDSPRFRSGSPASLPFAPGQRRRARGLSACGPVLHFLFHPGQPTRTMLLSKEYVGYLARELTKKMISGELIATKSVAAVTEKVHAAMLDELSLEDRINDEVRVILEAYSEEMQRTGANYQEMFRKVKSELTRKYKAVL
jgi:Protein of unknown function (DUF507)